MANDLLKQARERTPSPANPDLPMSREEFAEAINAYVWDVHRKRSAFDRSHISKYEQGRHHWSNAYVREACRFVLKVDSDADLGFYPPQKIGRHGCKLHKSRTEAKQEIHRNLRRRWSFSAGHRSPDRGGA